MSLFAKIEGTVCSGETVKTSGFYEPLDHKGECEIIESNLFLDKGSEAPKVLSCQHDVRWRFIPNQETL